MRLTLYNEQLYSLIVKSKVPLFLPCEKSIASSTFCDTYIRCDQLKNKSSRRVTYGNPCYSIGSKANSIYFLNDRSVFISY
jgi:hypothetical protein